ncbi:uncharacterized protein M421DRAFT_415930 [Didymella exigua CBS 183.55]|uniref:Uncharacterized protein n=1 Tax=Didymella exigua CBS 183.55 TaxID=1150837 RepID=A0A6A5S1W6_9PLEO|nr:uncharacterized protein M421DRAFT_415930 [Didymella exigua CBS 183.55]KAF1933590.1 hypothetical protein M421DRAFT_415930 [Didymella exigua CBS 183.55]
MMQYGTAFRFLDLPKELRLMVYDRIPCVIDHLALSRRDWSFFVKKQLLHRDLNTVHGDADSKQSVTLVVQTPPSSILTTCRTIYNEALHIISRRRQHPVLTQLKILCGADFLDVFSQQGGLLDIILNWTTPLNSCAEGPQELKTNEKIEDWLLDSELVTVEDTKHFQYFTLTHVINQVQQNLSSRHALPIEISLVPHNLHMLEQFMEIFYWRTMKKQGRVTIKVGMAGPQYYDNPVDSHIWEETLSYVLKDLDDAMDMRSLVYGTTSGMKLLRSLKLVGSLKTRWDAEWSRQR